MSKFIKCAIATVLVSLALGLPGKDTHAATSPTHACMIFDVEFMATPATKLKINCNGDPANYVAYYTPGSGAGSCPVFSAAQVQAWANMASAAYIAGKTVAIFWTGGPGVGDGQTCITSFLLSP